MDSLTALRVEQRSLGRVRGSGGDLPHTTGCSGPGQGWGATGAARCTRCSGGGGRRSKNKDTWSVGEGADPELTPPVQPCAHEQGQGCLVLPVELLVLPMAPWHKLSGGDFSSSSSSFSLPKVATCPGWRCRCGLERNPQYHNEFQVV